MRHKSLQQGVKIDANKFIVKIVDTFYATKHAISSLEQFDVLDTIEENKFGHIRLIRQKEKDKEHNNKYYTLYAIKKEFIYTSLYKKLHEDTSIFSDDIYLYKMINYYEGGNLSHILTQTKSNILNENQMQNCIAQLSSAIIYIHKSLDIILRDLSPKSILITNNGNIKLTDCSIDTPFNDEIISRYQQVSNIIPADAPYAVKEWNEKSKSVSVSTINYVASECFSQKGYEKIVDYWSIGCIMFECLIGFPPFYAQHPIQTCRKIVHYRKYFKIPDDTKLSKEAIDLMHNLICSRRRRYQFDQIIKHPWFKNIDWDNLMEMDPPFDPINAIRAEKLEVVAMGYFKLMEKECSILIPMEVINVILEYFEYNIKCKEPEIKQNECDLNEFGQNTEEYLRFSAYPFKRPIDISFVSLN